MAAPAPVRWVIAAAASHVPLGGTTGLVHCPWTETSAGSVGVGDPWAGGQRGGARDGILEAGGRGDGPSDGVPPAGN